MSVVAGVGWFAASDSSDSRDSTVVTDSPSADERVDAPVVDPAVVARLALEAADSEAGRIRLPEHGRLSLSRSDLPATGNLVLALDLPAQSRGTGRRAARVVSEDGRRLDTTARPIAGEASGLELAIDPAFLTGGRFMIEVETAESHPLQLRRWVLELK